MSEAGEKKTKYGAEPFSVRFLTESDFPAFETAETEKLQGSDATELDVVEAGLGIHRIAGNNAPCAEGEIYVVEPNTPHAFYGDADGEPLTVRRVFFNLSDWFSGETADVQSPRYGYGVFSDGQATAYVKLTRRNRKRVEGILDEIEAETVDKRAEWKDAVKALFTELFITLGRTVGDTLKETVNVPPKERLTVEAAMREAKEHYKESNLTLETIADSLFISQSYLSRLFLRYANESFSDYLRRLRIERACELLKATDLAIADVVAECGLKDVPTFYKAFGRATGMTPNQYRSRAKKPEKIYTETGEKNMDILNEISTSLQAGRAKVVKELCEQALGENISAKDVLEKGLLAGMDVVGQKFKNNEIYIPEVLVAARALNMGTQTLKPFFAAGEESSAGKVCLGTVQGDLHDIGKNLVKMMMEGKRIEVVDLGTDVPPEAFIAAVKEQNCQIICCSALLTTTMEVMKKVVELAEKEGIRDKIKIMIGGAPVSEEYCKEIGADVYTTDAATAAEAAVELLGVMNA